MPCSHDTNKRKRGTKAEDDRSSDSDDDGFTHITTSDLSNFPSDTILTVESAWSNSRPRRSTANYAVGNTPHHRGKRRQTEPAGLKPSRKRRSQRSAHVHNLPAQPPEVQRMVDGKTTTDDLRLGHPGRSDSLSVANLGRQLKLLNFPNPLHLITDTINTYIQHWRRPDAGNDAHATGESETSMIETVEREPGSRSSFTESKATVDSPQFCDLPSDDESPAWDSESTQSNTEAANIPKTPRKEARAPPISGYPRANKPYQRDVPPPSAIRPETSAFVWDQLGDMNTAQVLFDSGAEPNFVSREVVEALHFSLMPLNRSDMEIYETLGGHKDLATHYVTMDIAIKNLNLKRHTVSFFVVDSNRIDIVLGQGYIGRMGIWEKLVEKKGSRAYAIFSKKPTPEQIDSMLKEKERLAKKARNVEATIQRESTAATYIRKASSRDNSTNSVGSALSVQTTVDINSSIGSFMPNLQNHSSPSRKISSMTESTRTTLSGNSSWRTSFDSSQDKGGFCISPATTFSLKSTASSSFDKNSPIRPPEEIRLMRSRKKSCEEGEEESYV